MTGQSVTMLRKSLRVMPVVAVFIVVTGIFVLQICAAASGSGNVLTASESVAAPAIVRCDPTSMGGYTTQSATVDLYIENVADLYGADLRVTFDPAVAHVADHDLLSPGTQIEVIRSFLDAAFVLRDQACNVADSGDPVCPTSGVIWFAATQLNPSSPVSGSGPVARIVFRPVAAGTFAMTFTYHKLSNRDGIQIESEAQACTVEFSEPTSVAVNGLSATTGSSGVTVRWATLDEVGLAGFNVYRGRSSVDRLLLNPAVIPVAAGGAQGAFYEWLDRAPTAGELYWVESVPLAGLPMLHGPAAPALVQPVRVMLPLLLR